MPSANSSNSRRQLHNRIRAVWGFKKYKRDASLQTPLRDAQALHPAGSRRGSVPANEAGPTEDAVYPSPCLQPPAADRPLLDSATLPEIQLLPVLATPGPAAAQVPSSQLESADVTTRYLWLADILVGVRDSRHAFDIHYELWKAKPSSRHTHACIATAQYATQLVDKARDMARHDAGPFLGNARSQSWGPTFMDLLNAHTYDWGPGKENGLGQITRILNDIVEETDVQDRLVQLTPREAHLDVPVYTLFRSALEWYNSANPDMPIDAPLILDQFVTQHLSATRGPEQTEAALGRDLDSLRLCLEWCKTILASNLYIPPEVRGTDGDIVTETFAVLCALWRPLLSNGPPSYRAMTRSHTAAFPGWADTTEQQFGIRPPQLLCTVVCMIMAAAIQGQNMHAGLLEKALAGANDLSVLSSGHLLRRFLNQTCADNWRLKYKPEADRGFPILLYEVDPLKVEPFRRFVATALEIYDFPLLEPGVCLLDQLALAGPEFSEEGR